MNAKKIAIITAGVAVLGLASLLGAMNIRSLEYEGTIDGMQVKFYEGKLLTPDELIMKQGNIETTISDENRDRIIGNRINDFLVQKVDGEPTYIVSGIGVFQNGTLYGARKYPAMTREHTDKATKLYNDMLAKIGK